MGVMAGAHLSLAFLAYIDLLEFTIPTEFRFIAFAAEGDLWLWIHLACGLFVVTAIFIPRLYRQAMSASAGFLFGWSFFNMVWGLSTVGARDVSLAGPVLGLALAGGAYIMAVAPLPHEGGGH